jgi:hypothetical protein
MDGEVRQMSECRIDVLPRGLRFVLPAGSEIWKRPDFAGMDEQTPVAVEA